MLSLNYKQFSALSSINEEDDIPKDMDRWAVAAGVSSAHGPFALWRSWKANDEATADLLTQVQLHEKTA